MFYGTNTMDKAEAILREGIVPDMPSCYDANHAPVPGRIYLTGAPGGGGEARMQAGR
jgi:hypothetical protein